MTKANNADSLWIDQALGHQLIDCSFVSSNRAWNLRRAASGTLIVTHLQYGYAMCCKCSGGKTSLEAARRYIS